MEERDNFVSYFYLNINVPFDNTQTNEHVYSTVPDKGKPWFLYEAFQHIIKVQVEYLIKLGVDPALKVRVSHLQLLHTFLQHGFCSFKSPVNSSQFQSTTGLYLTTSCVFDLKETAALFLMMSSLAKTRNLLPTMYSELSLRRICSGPALAVHLEVFA